MRGLRLVQSGEGDDQARMTAGGVNALRSRVAHGEYVVDPHAVAEAMLSRMLIPAQLFEARGGGAGKGNAGPGFDPAEPGDG